MNIFLGVFSVRKLCYDLRTHSTCTIGLQAGYKHCFITGLAEKIRCMLSLKKNSWHVFILQRLCTESLCEGCSQVVSDWLVM